jgi:hypothetical protein
MEASAVRRPARCARDGPGHHPALVTAALAFALGHDQPQPPPESGHQRSPGVLRGYWEIG